MTPKSPLSRPTSGSLARKESWFAYANRLELVAPERLPLSAVRHLNAEDAENYARRRARYHANITLETPQLIRVHEAIQDIVDSDLQEFDRVRSSPVVDAEPGVGKSTAVNLFGRHFHRQAIEAYGAEVSEGTQRIPVVRVGLTGNTTPKSLAMQILDFYAHPARYGNALQLTSAALDCVLQCETQLVIIDDIHFLNLARRDGIEVSNTLKSLATDFPATFIFVGVGVEECGLFNEGASQTPGRLATAQLGRRWTRIEMPAFEVYTEQQRHDWRSTLLGIEKALVLADSEPGMIADDLSDYFFARTSGYIGSMMELIRLGALKAIRTGKERLTKELLDGVSIGRAAEIRRQQLEAALKAGKLRTLEKAPPRKGGPKRDASSSHEPPAADPAGRGG